MQLTRLPLLLSVAAFVVLTFLLYWPGLAGPFVLDDAQNVLRARLNQFDLYAIYYQITHNGSGPLGRGAAMLSFVLTSFLHGEGPWGFKFDNLLIHVANGLLIWRLLWLTLPLLEPRLTRPRTLLIAGVAAAVWVLHPLMISTVLYVVQRMVQLAVFFSLLALLCYCDYRQAAAAGWRARIMGWVLFPLCLLLALLSKETGALVPFYILVFELFVFRATRAELRYKPHLAIWLAVFVALPLVLGVVYVATHLDIALNYNSRNFTMGERLLTQIHALFFYIQLILLPRISSMSLFHDDFPLTTGADPLTLVLGVLLLLLVAGTWLLRKRLPVLAFGVAWFLVSHLLESTFLPLELVFEHRNYLALLGLVLPLVHYVGMASGRVPLLCLGAYCLILVMLTGSRAREWGNEELLLRIAVAEHPGSPRAQVSLANFLFNRGLGAEALEHMQAAALADPRDAGFHIHMLTWRCVVDGVRDEDLLRVSVEKLSLYPTTVYAANVLQNLLTQASRKTCTLYRMDELEQLIETALALPVNRANTEMHGYLLRFRGMLGFMAGRYDVGLVSFTEAYNLTRQVQIFGELVQTQILLGRLSEAQTSIGLLEQINTLNHGADTWLVNDLRTALEAAQESSAAVDSP